MTLEELVIASGEAARQSRVAQTALDYFAPLAMTQVGQSKVIRV